MLNEGLLNHSNAYSRMIFTKRTKKNETIPNPSKWKIVRNENYLKFFTIGTYNLNRFPKTKQAAELFLKFLFFYSPTVISLQEIVRKSYIRQLISTYNKHNPKCAYNLFISSTSYNNTHQAIITRRNLQNTSFFDLENHYRNPRELKTFRFPIATKFCVSGYSFSIVNVHFPYDRKKNRRDIINYLFTIIQDFYHNISETYYLIIAGDFNQTFRDLPTQIKNDYYTAETPDFYNSYDSILIMKDRIFNGIKDDVKIIPVENPTSVFATRSEHIKKISDHFPKLVRITG